MLIDDVLISPVQYVRDLGIHADAELSVWTVDVCPQNSIVLLSRSSSTASDPPTGTCCYDPEAGSCPVTFPAGLRQWRVGGYSCPCNASTPVGSHSETDVPWSQLSLPRTCFIE